MTKTGKRYGDSLYELALEKDVEQRTYSKENDANESCSCADRKIIVTHRTIFFQLDVFIIREFHSFVKTTQT